MYSMHINLSILKGMLNHYIRKTVLHGARFKQMTVRRLKLKTLTHIFIFTLIKENEKKKIEKKLKQLFRTLRITLLTAV